MGINRRDFFIQSALVLSAARSLKWVAGAVTSGEEPFKADYTGLGIETWKNGVCRLCPGGCGIRVRLIDGQPVKIEGNPLSPINRGGLCPTGHSGLQVLYNSDRIKSPMKRSGERGQGNWQEVTWEEALQTVREKMQQLRDQGTPHHLAFVTSDCRGAMGQLVRQFLQMYGSPNLIELSADDVVTLPFLWMHGKPARPAYDFLNARFVLSFGNDFLGTEGPPVWMANIYGQLRQPRRGARSNFVQVSSRFSMSSAKADKWIPILPGTAGVLALGIAYILLVEHLYDKSYVEKYTFGFEDWTDRHQQHHIGFKNLVLEKYYPERASQITGVPVDEIIRLARNLAENRPAIVFAGNEVFEQSNGFYSQLAVHSLNALLGSLNVKGGILEQPRDYPFALPRMIQDAVARKGVAQPRIDTPFNNAFSWYHGNDGMQLFRNLREEQPYSVKILFVHQANPVFTLPDPEAVKQALLKVPFLVSFSSFMDETTKLADLVLPDHTYLEKWDLDYDIPKIPYLHVGVNQPVVEPLHNTRHTGDVLIQLAQKMGVPLANSIPFRDYFQYLQDQSRSLYDSRAGFIPSSEFEEYMYGYMLERGFTYQRSETFEKFWQELLTNGSWMGLIARRGVPKFHTPSGKFEFYSQTFHQGLNRGSAREGIGRDDLDEFAKAMELVARGDELLLPHYEPPTFFGSQDSFPLYLLPFHIVTLFDGEGANRPMLLEMVGYPHLIRWTSWVEINPETAREYGIAEGDWLWIESEQGRLKTRAKFFPGALPGVIYLPIGLGHWDYGTYGSNRGVNPHQIISPRVDRLSRRPARQATRVRITRA